MENGSTYVNALKIKINSLKELKEVCRAIREAGNPYKYITIDTITAVEEMAKPLAISMYQNSPMFSEKYADVKDPAQLPNGCGFALVRQGIELIIEMIAKCAPNIIICGHVKDAALSEGATNSLKTLDLTGKASRILSAKSDAIGFVHRDENSNLCIQFGTNGEVLTGARPAHLANKDIIVAERQEDGTFISHWDRIYPSLSNK
uniref:AAA domain protein n=1 Tax=CrAss-like virus sp. ctYsL76 TaxID=2826826 RepID=A0A8S5QM71_9CAUD|nr:MAG TPA: AAA domain protein [CrAss-like virus sp. ctYsL76]